MPLAVTYEVFSFWSDQFGKTLVANQRETVAGIDWLLLFCDDECNRGGSGALCRCWVSKIELESFLLFSRFSNVTGKGAATDDTKMRFSYNYLVFIKVRYQIPRILDFWWCGYVLVRLKCHFFVKPHRCDADGALPRQIHGCM